MKRFSCIFILAVFGCNGGSGASDGTGSEVATAAISGGVTTSEASIALNSGREEVRSFARILNRLNPISSAWAVPSCSWSSLISACNSNSETLTYDGCSNPNDPAIKILGSESLVWTGAGCCTSAPLSASSTTPCSFVRRTVNASGATDPLVRSVGAHSVTLNTEEISGYDQPKTGGFGVACQGQGGNSTCEAQREITIAGAHYTGGRWDHTVSTDTPVVIQGHGATRNVLSGTVRVQHNQAKYTSITAVTSTLTHTEGCCFPTGGSIRTTFVGGAFDGKSESMTYGPGCGESTLSDTENQRTGLALHHCL